MTSSPITALLALGLLILAACGSRTGGDGGGGEEASAERPSESAAPPSEAPAPAPPGGDGGPDGGPDGGNGEPDYAEAPAPSGGNGGGPKSNPPSYSRNPAYAGSDPIRASRGFFPPHRVPPERFAAYGILAFPQSYTSTTAVRHRALCEAYVASLPPSGDLAVPVADQMVTVWPVRDAAAAEALNNAAAGPSALCDAAVRAYHLATAQQALADARQAGAAIDPAARGPFLLAWSPAGHKGRDDVPVLFADMSAYDEPARFREVLRKWRADIENDPAKWRRGWSLESLRIAIRDWADEFGPAVLQFWKDGTRLANAP